MPLAGAVKSNRNQTKESQQRVSIPVLRHITANGRPTLVTVRSEYRLHRPVRPVMLAADGQVNVHRRGPPPGHGLRIIHYAAYGSFAR